MTTRYNYDLSWNELTVKAPIKKSFFWTNSTNGHINKIILNQVNGRVKSGEMVAVIGCSGSGKTSLLEALSGTIPKGYSVSGTITVNGHKGKRIVQNKSSYLRQFTSLIPQLTVKEYLWYQFSLRVSKRDDDDHANRTIETLLQELGLTSVQNTVIGNNDKVKALSGGEIRRISFASEILGDPKFLFLDEPTTGLDSFGANECVAILKRLVASRNICALCTIHQPSSSTLMYFDQLILMTPLGKPAFQGDVQSALIFFKGFGLECPDNYNPCDFFLKHISLNGKDLESSRRLELICREYEKTLKHEGDSRAEPNVIPAFLKKDGMKYATSTINQIKVLLWMEFLWFLRFPNDIWKKSNRTIMVVLSFCCIFWQQTLSSVGAHNLTGAISEIVRLLALQHMFNGGFGLDKVKVLHDHKARLYSIHSYMISRGIIEISYCILDTVVLATAIYFAIGLDQTAEKWARFIGIIVLSNITASTTGELFRMVAPNIPHFVELTLFSGYFTRIYNGFYIELSSIPPYISWLKYLFYIYYSTEAVMINQWNDIKSLSCEQKIDSLCFKSGPDILRKFSFDGKHLYFDIECCCALLLCGKMLVYILFIKATK